MIIDPITALEGLQSAISVVRKAAKVANDLGGLAGVVGKLFDARSQATKAMLEAKRSGNKSNFSVAMQIENALMETAKLESQLELLYMQTGNILVWQKIKARAAEMDRDDAIEARKAKEEEKRRKEKAQEELEIAAGLTAGAFVLMMFAFGLYELFEFCTVNRCGK
jgi:antitoxin component of MazEF toxin-antitoxin module